MRHGEVVLSDRQRLTQIVINLLSNAVKYNRIGGRVTIAFTAGSREQRQPSRLTVTDTGAGIPPESLKLLFQPFERLGAEQTAIEGTGLGLALSRALAQAMGGRLGVDSVIDRGSTFWIELPAADAPSAAGSGDRARGDADHPHDGERAGWSCTSRTTWPTCG